MSTSKKRAPFLWCWASLGPVAMKRKSFSFFLNQLSSFGYYDDCDISDSKENREIAAVLDHVVAWPLQNAFTRKQQIQASIRAQYSHLLKHAIQTYCKPIPWGQESNANMKQRHLARKCQNYAKNITKITYIT
jgi:hypothetical protein